MQGYPIFIILGGGNKKGFERLYSQILFPDQNIGGLITQGSASVAPDSHITVIRITRAVRSRSRITVLRVSRPIASIGRISIRGKRAPVVGVRRIPLSGIAGTVASIGRISKLRIGSPFIRDVRICIEGTAEQKSQQEEGQASHKVLPLL